MNFYRMESLKIHISGVCAPILIVFLVLETGKRALYFYLGHCERIGV